MVTVVRPASLAVRYFQYARFDHNQARFQTIHISASSSLELHKSGGLKSGRTQVQFRQGRCWPTSEEQTCIQRGPSTSLCIRREVFDSVSRRECSTEQAVLKSWQTRPSVLSHFAVVFSVEGCVLNGTGCRGRKRRGSGLSQRQTALLCWLLQVAQHPHSVVFAALHRRLRPCYSSGPRRQGELCYLAGKLQLGGVLSRLPVAAFSGRRYCIQAQQRRCMAAGSAFPGGAGAAALWHLLWICDPACRD